MKTRQFSKSVIWAAILLVTCILGLIDWRTGYELNFFAFYFLPVGLAGWYLGSGPSLILSIVSSIVWFAANGDQPYTIPEYATWNTIIRLISFLAFGWSVARLKQSLDNERETTEALRRSLSEVKVLESFLPICAECKKIRTQQGVWQQLEVYIGQHANTQFSHGYCPECARRALVEAGLSDDPNGTVTDGISPSSVS